MATDAHFKYMSLLKKQCFGKVQHKSMLAAEYALNEMPITKSNAKLEIYKCPHCQYLHIGHNNKTNLSKMYTPEIITSLKANEVFVYGSNQFANHAGGAAKIAVENFGAINDIAAIGLCGQSYGIITTSFNKMPITLEFIEQQVITLYHFAKVRPDLTFYITKIGCGIAGFTIEEIGEIFVNLESEKPSNIILPLEFTLS